jgi:hypothetical protein
VCKIFVKSVFLCFILVNIDSTLNDSKVSYLQDNTKIFTFYLMLHSEYDGSIGLVDEKNEE